MEKEAIKMNKGAKEMDEKVVDYKAEFEGLKEEYGTLLENHKKLALQFQKLLALYNAVVEKFLQV